jgi:hypothetical protein
MPEPFFPRKNIRGKSASQYLRMGDAPQEMDRVRQSKLPRRTSTAYLGTAPMNAETHGAPGCDKNPRSAEWCGPARAPPLRLRRSGPTDGGGVRGAISVAFLEEMERLLRQQKGPDARLGDWFLVERKQALGTRSKQMLIALATGNLQTCAHCADHGYFFDLVRVPYVSGEKSRFEEYLPFGAE